ncbi:MAG: hypothetical protein NTW28_20615, partial [Candidatus Solibacter sp.]|nr:hypothetical protein [Candidatus Solibacter sp.]
MLTASVVSVHHALRRRLSRQGSLPLANLLQHVPDLCGPFRGNVCGLVAIGKQVVQFNVRPVLVGHKAEGAFAYSVHRPVVPAMIAAPFPKYWF